MKQLRPAVPGGPLYAEDLNELFEEVQRLSRLSVLGGEFQELAGGRLLTIRHPEIGFWARVRKVDVAGSGSGGICQPYEWWEQTPLGCGEFEDDPHGRTGTVDLDPAYSVPPDAVVADDSIVWLVRGLARTEISSGSGSDTYVVQEWYFQVIVAGGESGSGSGSGAECENMAANFPVRTPPGALPTDLLLTSDPINGTTVNYKLGDLIDSQLATTTPADREWPGRLKVDAHSGAITANADASTVTLDWSATNKHSVTLTANRTMAFANDVDGQAAVIIFKSGGTGAFTPVWPAGVKWQGGAAPTLTNASGHWDIVSILRESSGNYIGSTSMNYY